MHLELLDLLENLLSVVLVHNHLLEYLVLLLHLLLLLLLRLVEPLLLLLLLTMRVRVVSSIVWVLHSLLRLEVRRAKSLTHELVALVHLVCMRELLLVHLRIVINLVRDLNDLDFVAVVVLVLLLVVLRHLELVKHRLPLLLHLLHELSLGILLGGWHDLSDVGLLWVLEAHIRHVGIHISEVCCLEVEHVLTVVGHVTIVLIILEIIVGSSLVNLREIGCHHVEIIGI